MDASRALAPGALLATDRPYAERAEARPSALDRLATQLAARRVHVVQRAWARRPASPARFLRLVDAAGQGLEALDDTGLARRVRVVRAALRREGLAPARVAEAFALVREAAGRTLNMRHHATQLLAARGLVDGRLVEMATGEGKSLAATLAAATMAMAGWPVHAITVNDYLAERDALTMAPLYRLLGLTVGHVVQGLGRPERRAAYACDIAYCSSKELAFDYLRDRAAAGAQDGALHVALRTALRDAVAGPGASLPVLRGLVFAIVDEADSVCIDEARTPLILSAQAAEVPDHDGLNAVLALARTLQPGEDFMLDAMQRQVRLLAPARAQLESLAEGRAGWWRAARAREERLQQALAAVHLYHRDEHYVVDGGKVVIVDESTGRVMPDRAWQGGLHTLVELKESLRATPPRETLARLTFQRLLRRYLRLSGMTGTAREVAAEIRTVYRLPLLCVPLARPSRRISLPPTMCRDEAQKWQHVADRVQAVAIDGGRAVLVGTRSVRASEALSAVLSARGIAHALLNAKQDQEEARVVAEAGQPQRVTVATNMAGRGTDIRLADTLVRRGGLHVILTEHHESGRIDRQLQGRCARQHDPGSVEAIVALDDEIYLNRVPAGLRRALGTAALSAPAGLARAAYRVLTWIAQTRAEHQHAALRQQTLQADLLRRDQLAFAGASE